MTSENSPRAMSVMPAHRRLAVGRSVCRVDHQAVATWRLKQALGRTWQRRPDLLADRALDDRQRALLEAYLDEQGGQDSE